MGRHLKFQIAHAFVDWINDWIAIVEKKDHFCCVCFPSDRSTGVRSPRRSFCGSPPAPPPPAPPSFGVDRVAARPASRELVLLAPSSEQRDALERAGNNAALVRRCALKTTGDALACFFSFNDWKYLYEVRNEVLPVDSWRPVAFNKKEWVELARSCGPEDFVRDRDQQGTRSDLLACTTVDAAPPPLSSHPSSDAAMLPSLLQPSNDPTSSQQQPALPPVVPDPMPAGAVPESRVPRAEFTCAGLTPKAPRHWETLADALPALRVRPRDALETPEEQRDRLCLPLLDPRAADDRQARNATSSYYPFRGQRWYLNAYESLEYRTELVRFLHALRCIVDGVTEMHGVEFRPELWRLPEPVTRSQFAHYVVVVRESR